MCLGFYFNKRLRGVEGNNAQVLKSLNFIQGDKDHKQSKLIF